MSELAAQSPGSMHPLGLSHFLCQFLEPRSLKQFKLPWRLLLDDDPVKIAEQLRSAGLLESDDDLWVCSATGRTRADDFLRQQGQQRARVEAAVLQALAQEDFAQAADVYLDFESRQPFPNDVALNPTAASRQSLCEDLQELAKACPQGDLRDQVALAWLWSDRAPLSVEGEVVRTSVTNLRDLQRFAREGLAQVLILSTDPQNCCAHCRGLHDKVFAIDQAPKLPAGGCLNNPPCTLTYLPDMS